MNKDPFKEYIKESEPGKRDKRFLRNLLLNEKHPLHNRTLWNYSSRTASHILKLREAFPGQAIFGRSDVMELIDIKPSRASEFLKEMAEQGVIEPVSGHGKGKYRFRFF